MVDYEHAIISQAFDVSWADLTPLAIAGKLADSAGWLIPKLEEGLATLKGGGWEVVSHDLLRLEDGLLISVMARRPRT